MMRAQPPLGIRLETASCNQPISCSLVAVGDRVAIEPGVPCRMCGYCKTGVYNLCPDVKFGSCPPCDGMLTNYFKHPADFCFK